MENILRQELTCHNCNTVVQFDVDVSLNGNHVLNCPKCQHEHCRVVENGVITDHRWDSRNPDFQISTYTITCSGTESWNYYSSSATQITWNATSTVQIDNQSTTGTSDIFCYQNWMNVSTSC